MGESVVKAPDVLNKMGGSVTPHGALEVSISFGRFENDSLSWEKWSTFSPNKYLEEVEKCSTPGSVAQKKAYFEAHYKKIAARKAELLEKENMMGTDSSRSNEMDCTDHSTSTSGTDTERGIIDGQSFAEEVEQDPNLLIKVSSSLVNEPAEADGNALECQNSLVESVAEDINEKLQSKEVIYPEKADLITEEILKIPEEVQDTDEQPLEMVSETINVVTSNEEISEFNAQTTAKKVRKTKKEQNLARIMKKKPVLPATKSSELSTPKTPRISKPVLTSTPKTSKPIPASNPRLSKPIPASTPRLSKSVPASNTRSSKPGSTATPRFSKLVSTSSPTLSKSVSTSTPRLSKPASASTSRLSKPISTPIVRPVSQSSTGKSNVSSSPRSKNSSITVIKRVPPTSLHKSLDSVCFTTTRKSLIMEQMGDKDIVKRAFKSFQNNSTPLKSSGGEKPCGPRPVSARGLEHSSSVISQNESERTRKATEKMNAQRNHVGTKWSTTSSRSLIETGVGKDMKPTLSSVDLKSDERAEKRKAFFRNLEEKSYAREEEKKRLSSKPKEVVNNNIGNRPE